MAVLDYVNSTVESARQQADRVVTPDSRQKAYDVVYAFAQQRPVFFSFLVAQALFSLLPVLLFASFVLATFSLAIISALLFALFWSAIAALVLASTLFVSSALALLAWAWLMGAYLAISFAHGIVAGLQQGSTDQQRTLNKSNNLVKQDPAFVDVNGVGGDETLHHEPEATRELDGEGGL